MDKNKENAVVRKRGRPRKKSKNVQNVGRKRVDLKTACKSTLYNRVNEILNDDENILKVVNLAASIKDKRIKRINNCNGGGKQDTVNKGQMKHTKETALAFFLDYDYSKSQYRGLTSNSRSRECSIYPDYSFILKVQKECQPDVYIINSETEVCVSLQIILNSTAERICDSVASNWHDTCLHKLEMDVTLGFDSSSGHVNPHQKYKHESIDNQNRSADQSLFVSSFILLQVKSSSCDDCCWINPTPQSPRFCRPLRIAFEKETEDVINQEFNRLNVEENALIKHRFTMINGNKVRVKFNVHKTLFDGKCLNAIGKNKSTVRCPFCLRTAHQFGNLNDLFTPQDSLLNYGIALLHAKIKILEHLLHISYRLTIKTWDVKKELKSLVEERKLKVQNKLYETFGIKVDLVLQGFGTTNTGNLARKCLSDPELFARSLDIDSAFVSHLATIVLAFSCKRKLNLDLLEKFCWKTYCLHYQLYPWARMNPSIHKLLKHGCEVARKFPLPIAYYAEDASESWHKLYRRNMTKHSRQTSRKNRILDVFNKALHFSDPKISLVMIDKRLKNHKVRKLPPEVLTFILDGPLSGGICESEESDGEGEIYSEDSDAI